MVDDDNDNDALRHELDDVMALVQEQMHELSVMQQKRSELEAKGLAADGIVEVTVDARRVVTAVVIDESYLDEYEFADLAGHVTTAAQAAFDEMERRSAALLAPLRERRGAILAQAGSIGEIPDFQSMFAAFEPPVGETTPSASADGTDDDQDASRHPIVRK